MTLVKLFVSRNSFFGIHGEASCNVIHKRWTSRLREVTIDKGANLPDSVFIHTVGYLRKFPSRVRAQLLSTFHRDRPRRDDRHVPTKGHLERYHHTQNRRGQHANDLTPARSSVPAQPNYPPHERVHGYIQRAYR